MIIIKIKIIIIIIMSYKMKLYIWNKETDFLLHYYVEENEMYFGKGKHDLWIKEKLWLVKKDFDVFISSFVYFFSSQFFKEKNQLVTFFFIKQREKNIKRIVCKIRHR